VHEFLEIKETKVRTAEQRARDMLERMGVENAQSMSAGDVVELANLISERDQAITLLAERKNRIPAARQAAEAFLRKWPEGPQLEGILVERPDTTHPLKGRYDGVKVTPSS
jgi:hypothetical protein